jgi:flagellar assembly factor FliW
VARTAEESASAATPIERSAPAATPTVAVVSPRFGSFDVPEDRIFALEPGLVGFPGARRFVLLDSRPGSPFKWMLCIDEPDLGFAVVDPTDFVPRYAPPLELAAAALGCAREDVALFALVTIPEQPSEIFVNLLAPIVVDLGRRRGRQLVLEDPALDPAHRIALAPRPSAPA